MHTGQAIWHMHSSGHGTRTETSCSDPLLPIIQLIRAALAERRPSLSRRAHPSRPRLAPPQAARLPPRCRRQHRRPSAPRKAHPQPTRSCGAAAPSAACGGSRARPPARRHRSWLPPLASPLPRPPLARATHRRTPRLARATAQAPPQSRTPPLRAPRPPDARRTAAARAQAAARRGRRRRAGLRAA